MRRKTIQLLSVLGLFAATHVASAQSNAPMPLTLPQAIDLALKQIEIYGWLNFQWS